LSHGIDVDDIEILSCRLHLAKTANHRGMSYFVEGKYNCIQKDLLEENKHHSSRHWSSAKRLVLMGTDAFSNLIKIHF